jgi:hypothetical protein
MKDMLVKFALPPMLALLTVTVAAAQTSQFATATEAKAMLDKAVAALKADRAKALRAFNEGVEGFKDRDLYPFCADASSGVVTAHPKLKGLSLKKLKDTAGKNFGAEIMSSAKEGEVIEVEYKWPRPGGRDPVQKVSYVTKVDDQVCAVGYYK